MSNPPKRKFDRERFFSKLGRSIKKRLHGKKMQRRIGESWSESENTTFVKRVYNSYDDYLTHQKSKLEVHDLDKYDVEFRKALRSRLEKSEIQWRGKTVLCLAARIGTEVKAFLDLNCFAIGIDLNPGKKNRYVVHGDFHDLQYADESVDFVFTNSLDHAFEIDRVAKEIGRVLKSNGMLIVEAVKGKEEGVNPGFYESFFWSRIDELVGLFEKANFKCVRRTPFEYPWAGEQLCFQKSTQA